MLPFGRIELKGQKIKPFSEQPVTLGEHLRKRRLELGLFQREVAHLLAADSHSVSEWEKDHAKPGIRFWPAIIGFLGYDPHPEPRTLGEGLRAKRRVLERFHD
jgi:DNA-binding XRE family transcriptional regulator